MKILVLEDHQTSMILAKDTPFIVKMVLEESNSMRTPIKAFVIIHQTAEAVPTAAIAAIAATRNKIH
jgi:hypothetical protein